MKNYLITGLPRSRTAWFAEFMGCDHEPTFHMDTVDDIAAYFAKNRGASDHGLGFFVKHIVEDLGIRTLIVERSIEDVIKSLGEFFPHIDYRHSYDFCLRLAGKLDEVKKNPLVMVLPFEKINNLNHMEKAFWHLCPGEAFDEGKYLAMRNTIVEVDLPALLKKLPSSGRLMRDLGV